MKKQQESLKNMVYQAILNGIFTDEYKPNQIINEQELVQKFGCSKTPIREALVTLCNEGILRSFPRFGYQVVSVSREEAQNILDFRLVLEGGYLRQSIGHITEENLAELAEIDERCKQSTDSVWVRSRTLRIRDLHRGKRRKALGRDWSGYSARFQSQGACGQGGPSPLKLSPLRRCGQL